MNPPDLDRIISRVDDLPTLPRTVLRITELVNDPKSSARDLARVITDDQVLAARLLKLVNSSFYGFPQRISTITGATKRSVIVVSWDGVPADQVYAWMADGSMPTFAALAEEMVSCKKAGRR